eukprot:TRINITY_DN87547_c0_g1_i1.p1 TRINITY_DN87547_c0_g1~~TRINITY_DN87547_c0_g1_i1.p1  ORF type:complete len:194 (-),score=24.00 TRINITY_DN87547_c0_g1_i1:635-1216(-)
MVRQLVLLLVLFGVADAYHPTCEQLKTWKPDLWFQGGGCYDCNQNYYWLSYLEKTNKSSPLCGQALKRLNNTMNYGSFDYNIQIQAGCWVIWTDLDYCYTNSSGWLKLRYTGLEILPQRDGKDEPSPAVLILEIGGMNATWNPNQTWNNTGSYPTQNNLDSYRSFTTPPVECDTNNKNWCWKVSIWRPGTGPH